ncbi:MAG: hypothetical protein KUG82_01040 [Pseudomonadales bacterium]|nr:hypothetical protein [Pseudomonadales bacterium]
MKQTAGLLNNGLNLDFDRDTTLLIKLLDTLNGKYFEGRIKTEIQWAAPEGTVNIYKGKKPYHLNPTNGEALEFESACRLIEEGQFTLAKPYLKKLADLGHSQSQLYLIHMLSPDSLCRERLSRQYNMTLTHDNAIPAACYYPKKHLIVIHPFLLEKNAPQFVIRYLIYHECCHQFIEDSTHDKQAHSPAFMKLEYNAPNREKALNWLEREGFPTIRLTDPDRTPQTKQIG